MSIFITHFTKTLPFFVFSPLENWLITNLYMLPGWGESLSREVWRKGVGFFRLHAFKLHQLYIMIKAKRKRMYCPNAAHCLLLCHYVSLIWMLQERNGKWSQRSIVTSVWEDLEGASSGGNVPIGSWWSFLVHQSGTGRHHQRSWECCWRRKAQKPQERMQLQPRMWK